MSSASKKSRESLPPDHMDYQPPVVKELVENLMSIVDENDVNM